MENQTLILIYCAMYKADHIINEHTVCFHAMVQIPNEEVEVERKESINITASKYIERECI